MQPSSNVLLSGYRPREYFCDNGFSVDGIVAGFMLASLAGSLCGAFLAFFGHYFMYLILVFPAMIGLAIAATIRQSLSFTRVRNRTLLAAFAVAASITAVLAIHVTNYHCFRNEIEDIQLAEGCDTGDAELLPAIRFMFHGPDRPDDKAKEVSSFVEFMEYRAAAGVEIGSARRPGSSLRIPLGTGGTIFMWVIELLVIAGTSVAGVWEMAKNPFCSRCGEWQEGRELGNLDVNADICANLFRSGTLNTIGLLPHSGRVSSFRLFRCPKCNSPDESVLQVNSENRIRGYPMKSVAGCFYLTDAQASEIEEWLFNSRMASPAGLQPLPSAGRQKSGLIDPNQVVAEYMLRTFGISDCMQQPPHSPTAGETPSST